MIKKLILAFTLFTSTLALAADDKSLYVYKATVRSVYDGDTIRADLDLGLNIVKVNEPLRLYGLDAPEVRGAEKEEGYVSRDYLRSILSFNDQLIVETVKDKKGKYGRYIAVLWVKGKGKWCAKNTWCNVNQHLIDKGYAEAKEY